jgi:hypothetical protein
MVIAAGNDFAAVFDSVMTKSDDDTIVPDISPIPWNPGWPAPAPTPGQKGYWMSHGNHRFKIVSSTAGQNIVDVKWLRTDSDPLAKVALLLEEKTASPVTCTRLRASADSAQFTFNSSRQGAIFYLYYMPFTTCEYENGACRSGARSTYLDNLTSACQPAAGPLDDLAAEATAVVEAVYQPRDSFQSFDPMGFAMTATERAALVASQLGEVSNVLLVAEDRSRPIAGRGFLPAIWANNRGAESAILNGTAAHGEHYTWQLAVVALTSDVTVTNVSFSEFQGQAGLSIPASAFSCMNVAGVDYWGRPFVETANVTRGEVRALWMAAKIPLTSDGQYTGTVSIKVEPASATGGVPEKRTVPVHLLISGTPLPHGGDDDIKRGTRMHWFDSTVGLDDTIPSPYTPLVHHWVHSVADQRTVTMLGKAVTILNSGAVSSIVAGGTSVLASPLRLDIKVGNEAVALKGWRLKHISESDASVHWVSYSARTQNGIAVSVEVTIDFTGFIDYAVTVTASDKPVSALSVDLVVPSDPANAHFFVGLGKSGGFLKQDQHWLWDGVNGNSGAWVGSTHGGVRVYLKGADAMWQAGDPFDSHYSPPAPDSWSNEGKGGVTLHKNGTFVAFTGARMLTPGTPLLLNFSLMVSPTRPLNLTAQFRERWVQIGGIDNYTQLAEAGATVVNIHQGNTQNPWINYPYLTNDLLREAADECHSLGMRYSICAFHNFNLHYVYQCTAWPAVT